jgi:hypothetical protein
MKDPFDRAVLRDRLARWERRTRHLAAGFRLHVTVFSVVNIGLVLLWVVDRVLDGGSSWEDPWFVYTLVIWGLVLAVHGWSVRAHVRRDAVLRARLDDSEAAS